MFDWKIIQDFNDNNFDSKCGFSNKFGILLTFRVILLVFDNKEGYGVCNLLTFYKYFVPHKERV